MSIHIGKRMNKAIDTMDIPDIEQFCLDKLKMTKQNFYRILKKGAIHTDLVERFSAAFDYDFFSFFYEEEPLKSLSNREIEKLQAKNQELKDTVARKEDLIKDQERKIKYLKEEIEHLKNK